MKIVLLLIIIILLVNIRFSKTQLIKPVYNCQVNSNGFIYYYFGYNNTNRLPLTIPLGPLNRYINLLIYLL